MDFLRRTQKKLHPIVDGHPTYVLALSSFPLVVRPDTTLPETKLSGNELAYNHILLLVLFPFLCLFFSILKLDYTVKDCHRHSDSGIYK